MGARTRIVAVSCHKAADGISRLRSMATTGLVLTGLLLVSSCQQPPAGSGVTATGSAGSVTRVALEARAAGSGQFTRLGSSECGIDFVNEVTDPILQQQEIHLQGGVASGDYDGDGDLDLFLTGLQSRNRLYRNDGGMRFTDVTAELGDGLDGGDNLGSSGHFVDLTGDGKLDLLVCNRIAPNQFFRQADDGKFVEEAGERGLDDIGSTVSAAMFDMENDGDLDVYFTNYRHSNVNYHVYLNRTGRSITGPVNENGEPLEIEEDLRELFYISESGEAKPLPQADRMLRNDGKGNFTDVTEESGLYFHGWSFQPQACDFNDDGYTDLYVSSDFETADRMFINDGTGSFVDVTSQRIRKTPLFSMGCDTGDINGDGLPDLVTSDMASRSYERSKRQSGDMYEWRYEMLYADPQPQMRNMLYVNRGEAFMSELAQYSGVASTEWTWSMRLADLDCDGTDELFVTNGMLRDSMDVDKRMEAERLLSLGASDAELSEFWNSLEDYLTDNLLFTRESHDSIEFSLASGNWGLNGRTMSCGAVIADLDMDGDPDIVINNTNDQAMVYHNDLAGGNTVQVDLRQPGANWQAAGARMKAYVGDRVILRDVILSRGFVTGESSRQSFGLGDSSSIDRLEIRWPDGRLQDVEGLEAGYLYTINRSTDLRDPAPASQPMFEEQVLDFMASEKLTDDEEFEAEPLLPFQQSTQGPGLAVADFNMDGSLDAYFCGPAGVNGQLMFGDGKGSFSDSGLSMGIPVESEEMAAVVLDANGDGRPDLYVSCGGMESSEGSEALRDRLLLNMLPEGFISTSLPLPAQSTAAVCPLDADNDGDTDLIVCGHIQRFAFGRALPNHLLLNDGAGNFSPAQGSLADSIRMLGQVKDMQAADIDNDGNMDLIVSRDWDSVAVLYGSDSGFGTATAITGKGWWRGLCLFDADCDGDLDIAATNAGANIKYHPKEDAPVLLKAHDFDGNGTRDLVEVKWKGGDMMPGRGRSCSGYAINTIPQNFPTWKSFANASLEEIYGEGLEEAEDFIAEELHSVVCINDGKRGFTVTELPEQAQWMPCFSASSADFNADGNPDLFLGGNFSGTQPETGKWNAGYGCLLLGDGQGGFSNVEPHQSGIYLYQDVRATVVADFNGDALPDLLAAASNDQPRLMLNRSVAGGGYEAVELPGGSNASQEVLVLSDGRRICRRTVQSGYLASGPAGNVLALPAGLSVESVE